MCVPSGACAYMQACLCPCVCSHSFVWAAEAYGLGLSLQRLRDSTGQQQHLLNLRTAILWLGEPSFKAVWRRDSCTPQAVLLNGSPLMIQYKAERKPLAIRGREGLLRLTELKPLCGCGRGMMPSCQFLCECFFLSTNLSDFDARIN